MRRISVFSTFLSVALGALVTCNPAFAQVRGPAYGINQANQPPFSPYNLLRPGINPVISYYGAIRPQLGYNANILQLQQQQQADVAAIQQQQQQMQFNAGNVLPPTGTGAGFLTQSRYFMTRGSAGAGGVGAGGMGTGSGLSTGASAQFRGSSR